MSRIRLINPAGPKDEAVAACSVHARLAWVYLPCHADKLGRLEDKPFSLKLDIFPTDPHVDMGGLLDELARVNLIRRYQVGGKGYIAIRTFARHQRPHRNEAASAIPPPPEDSLHFPSESVHSPPLPEPTDHFPSARADPDPDPVLDPIPDPVRADPRAPDPAKAVPTPAAVVRQAAEAGETWTREAVTLPPLGVRAQKLVDLFGRKRSELVRGALPWHAAGRGLFEKALQLAREIEDDPQAQADVERTMELSLKRAADSQDPKDSEAAWAFGTWVSRFTDLREEARGLRRGPGVLDQPCAFHAGGHNTGKLPRKHEIRLECAECKHVTTRAGPRPAARPESAAEIWETSTGR